MRAPSLRAIVAAIALTVASSMRPDTIVAQGSRLFLGGGAALYGSDAASVSFHGLAGITFPLTKVLALRVDGLYTRAFDEDVATGTLDVQVQASSGTVRPYLLVGAGGIVDNGFHIARNAGVGIAFGGASARFFAEARYFSVMADGTSYFEVLPITLGLQFGT